MELEDLKAWKNIRHHVNNKKDVIRKLYAVDFTTNGEHALALDKHGFVYSWGKNDENQLGRPDTEKFEIEKVTIPLGVRVDQIACGSKFSFALTTEGKMYEWGINGFKRLEMDIANKELTNQHHEVVDSITCSRYYPMVLTKTGKVYIPNLPYAKTVKGIHVVKLQALGYSLVDKKVIQVSGGKRFAFALTIDGEIFQWTLMQNTVKEPKYLDIKIGRAVKMWASSSADILVVKNSYGNLFSFSWIDDELIKSSLNFTSGVKYFESISEELQGPAYIKPIAPRTNEVQIEWKQKFREAFGKKDGSDITFLVEEKEIFAHIAIVSTQCSYLKAIINSELNKNPENRVIAIKNYSHLTYLRFLKCLYTGNIEPSSHEENMELLQLAHEYNEKALLKMCESMVTKGLSVENAFITYKLAKFLELPDLVNGCKAFISNNFEAIFFSKEVQMKEKDILMCFLRDMFISGHICSSVKRENS